MFDEQPDGDIHGECANEIHKLESAVATLEAQLAEARADLETGRMRLAACGVAALCDTPKSSVDQRIGKDNPYWSASYGDVCRQIDSLIQTRAERDAAVALRAVFGSAIRHDTSFSWDGTKQCHVPWIRVEFADVPGGEPNTAQGWRDRDAFAAAIDAIRKESGDG